MGGARDEVQVEQATLQASRWLTRLEMGELPDPHEFDSWVRADAMHVREVLEMTCMDLELQAVEFTEDVPAADLVRQVRRAAMRDRATGDVVPLSRASKLSQLSPQESWEASPTTHAS